MDLILDNVRRGRRTRNVRKMEILIIGRRESSDAITTAQCAIRHLTMSVFATK